MRGLIYLDMPTPTHTHHIIRELVGEEVEMHLKLPVPYFKMVKKEEKCLVTEAREKCQCEDCKLYKEMRDFNLKWYIQKKATEIYWEAIKHVGIGVPSKKLK